MTHFTLSPQASAAVPLYHWRGARPWLLDLESDQTGWLICLSLSREGDCSLLPIAWQEGIADLDTEIPAAPVHTPPSFPAPPISTLRTEALDSEAVSLMLADLRQDGWRVNGRLTLQFTGRDAEPDFQQNIETYLWQKPGAAHGA
ncbi:MAG: hypothetical protein ACE5EY_06600 [Anaerolineae bacterium]